MPREGETDLGGAQDIEFGDLLEQVLQIKVYRFERQFLRLDFRKIENVVDDCEQRLGTRTDDSQITSLRAVQRGIEQQRRHSHDAVHRRTDFVRHHRQKRCFGLIGQFGFFARGDQILLDANARRDVVETENAADDSLVEVLRQRPAFEDPAVGEREQVVALLFIDDLAQASATGVAIVDLGADAIDDRRVVVP